MQSTLTLPDTDPHDIFVVEPDVVLAARGGNTSAPAHPDPVHEILSHLSQRRAQAASPASTGAAPPKLEPTPTVDTTFRATDTAAGEPSAIGRWTRRVSIAFLFALGSAFAGVNWSGQSEAARQMIANWLPPFVLAALPITDKPALAEQPPGNPPPVLAAAADPAPAQPAASPTAPDAAAPQVAAVPADSAQLLQSMAHDLSAMGQQIEQLKASIEQIKTAQIQMSRDMAAKAAVRTSEAKPTERPKIVGAPPRPLGTLAHNPRPGAYYPQAPAGYPPAPAGYTPSVPPPAMPQSAPPAQTALEPDGEPVSRPPMPLR